jgi:2,3-dihydroxybenzoate-AMP ligase
MLPGAVSWPDDVASLYRREGLWVGEPLGAAVRRHAERQPDALALVDARGRWTYAELDVWVDRLAAGLADRGIRSRDRVVVQLPNVAELVVVVLAAFRLGAIPVMALPAHRRTELEALARISAAVALVIPDVLAGTDHRVIAREVRSAVPGLRHVLVAGDVGGDATLTGLAYVSAPPRALPAPDPADVALLQLSGGTTGTPKLIPRTHDDYLYSVRASVPISGLRPDSVQLVALPAAHNFPMSSPGFLGALDVGATVVLAASPSPEVAFPLIERERVTVTALVPPLALVWLAAAPGTAHDLSSLELLQVGGAKLSQEVARRVRPTLGCDLQQVFGMAEGLVNYTRLGDPQDVVLGTQGRPISQRDEVRVVDDDDVDVAPGVSGNLLTRGPYTIRGYYRAPEHNALAFTADGFFRTGDVVRLTAGGDLVVEGRSKDQINRGGEKIAPEEVENHLLAHPGVHDAAVVAVTDPYLGERACAWVVARGEARPTAMALRAFLRTRGIADYKVPDRFEFRDAFPATGIGKVSKAELRRLVQRELAGPASVPDLGPADRMSRV